MFVLGIDGAPNGWAVVVYESGTTRIRRVGRLADVLAGAPLPDIAAIDVPIGLLDAYEAGGRPCDRQARTDLKERRSSVFTPPVRAVLGAATYKEACDISRASSPNGKAISRQTWEIIPKIKETDDLLRLHPHLRGIVREIHPEISFLELVGRPMKFRKGSPEGRAERGNALSRIFDLERLLKEGQSERLPKEDILDALVACWSAMRLGKGDGRSIAPGEKTIWI